MSRLLGIDYGSVRVGLAISDLDQNIAFEYEIWPRKTFFKKIGKLIAEKEIKKIILGYPLNLKGGHSHKTDEVIKFKIELTKKLGIAVELLDERFSTKLAQSLNPRKKDIDALAAQAMLQSYLDHKTKQ